MGGRGASSMASKTRASERDAIERYRIIVGDSAVDNLRKRGASDSQIAKVAVSYSANCNSGMGKREARIQAEIQNGFGSAAQKRKKTKPQSKTTAKTSSESNPPVNGYGERTSRYITSGTYEREIKRTQRNVNSWFGRGM